MSQRKFDLLLLGPPAAVLGVLAASFTVSDPASSVAVPFLALVGIGLTVVFARAHKERTRAEFLLGLMLLGVGVRLLVFSLIHSTVGPYVLAPDAETFEGWGQGLLNYFVNDAPFPNRLEDTLQLAYPAWNAFLFLIFGPAKAAPAMTNIFFSCWTAVPLYHLALHASRGDEVVARWTAALTVLFPSLVLWSVLNVREAPTILVISTTVYFFARLQRQTRFVDILGAALGLAILTLFREYLTALVAGGGIAGVLIGRGRRPERLLLCSGSGGIGLSREAKK